MKNLPEMASPHFAPLLPAEKELLQHFLRAEKLSLAGLVLSAFTLAAIMPFMPSRHHDWHLPTSKEDCFRQFILYSTILAVGVGLYYFQKTRNLRRDIASGNKVTQTVTVKTKYRTRLNGTCSIQLDIDEPAFRQININLSEFERIEVGQPVALSYALHSKHLFGINWQPEKT